MNAQQCVELTDTNYDAYAGFEKAAAQANLLKIFLTLQIMKLHQPRTVKAALIELMQYLLQMGYANEYFYTELKEKE